MFRVAIARSVRGGSARARAIHTLPDLGFERKAGIPGLFSAKGLDIAWFQYQEYLLDNLNSLLKERENYTGREFETPSSVMVAALEDQRDPVAAKIAHWASLAYSNEFFFQSLSKANRNPSAVLGPHQKEPAEFETTEDLEYTIPSMEPFKELTALHEKIRTSFDHPLAFRELLLSRGSSIFGNGFVWVIKDVNFKVLNCYNSGTPVSGSAKFYQPNEINCSTRNDISGVIPLVAVNLWQHTYLEDYGVEGKRDFLRNVFDTINWQVVNARAALQGF